MTKNFDYNNLQKFFPFIDSENLFITYKNINEKIINPLKETPFYSLTTNKFFINIPNIAKYLINGNEIHIERYNNDTLEKEINLFLIDAVLPVYFMQKGLICLKGTAIKKDEKNYLINWIWSW